MNQLHKMQLSDFRDRLPPIHVAPAVDRKDQRRPTPAASLLCLLALWPHERAARCLCSRKDGGGRAPVPILTTSSKS